MRIGYVKAGYSSQITVNEDIDMLGLYQVKNLANPGAGEALKKGHAGIVDADVAVGAAIAYAKLNLALAVKNTDIALATGIVYSKLNLADRLVMADLAAAIKNAANGLAVLDASADVPLAQIPDTLTGKDADTVDGEQAAAIVTNARVKAHFPDTIANVLSDHDTAAHDALGIDAATVDGEALSTFVELVGGEHHRAATSGNWDAWDLSAIVPEGTKYVLVVAANEDATSINVLGVRKHGTALERKAALDKVTVDTIKWQIALLTECDVDRVIDIYGETASKNFFSILGYWA